jgi:hypothetical protein
MCQKGSGLHQPLIGLLLVLLTAAGSVAASPQTPLLEAWQRRAIYQVTRDFGMCCTALPLLSVHLLFSWPSGRVVCELAAHKRVAPLNALATVCIAFSRVVPFDALATVCLAFIGIEGCDRPLCFATAGAVGTGYSMPGLE